LPDDPNNLSDIRKYRFRDAHDVTEIGKRFHSIIHSAASKGYFSFDGFSLNFNDQAALSLDDVTLSAQKCILPRRLAGNVRKCTNDVIN
jgi:hypothetical protein